MQEMSKIYIYIKVSTRKTEVVLLYRNYVNKGYGTFCCPNEPVSCVYYVVKLSYLNNLGNNNYNNKLKVLLQIVVRQTIAMGWDRTRDLRMTRKAS